MALAPRLSDNRPVTPLSAPKVVGLRDAMPPTPLKHKGGPDTLTIGWWVHPAAANPAAEGRRPQQLVGRGCTNGVSHSIFSTAQTHSKGHGEFYATRKEALLALRFRKTNLLKALASASGDLAGARNQGVREARRRAS
jgi:hypothetical protein